MPSPREKKVSSLHLKYHSFGFQRSRKSFEEFSKELRLWDGQVFLGNMDSRMRKNIFLFLDNQIGKQLISQLTQRGVHNMQA